MSRASFVRAVSLIATVAAAALLAGCRGAAPAESTARAAGHAAPLAARLTVPAGFKVQVFSASVPGARSLTLGAKGTVFVGTKAGSVYALVDSSGDGTADAVHTIASGLDMPNGVAFRQG